MKKPKAFTHCNTRRTTLTMVAALATLVTGCVTTPAPKPLNLAPLDAIQYMEQVLATSSSANQPFHAAVYYPFEHALRYPGLVIGIEQSESHPVRAHFNESALLESALSDMPQFRDMLLDQSRVMFISHVIRTQEGATRPNPTPEHAARKTPCFIYNAYQPETIPPAQYRLGIDQIVLCGPAGSGAEYRPTDNYFANGWLALDRIRHTLAQEIGMAAPDKYTDVILIVMGWNTPQIEAIQNFNSIIDRLHLTRPAPGRPENDSTLMIDTRAGSASGTHPTQPERPFRPYVIGVTWPSQWVSQTAKPVVEAASVFHKANDADELGGGWLAALLDYALHPALAAETNRSGKRLPLTIIGHSYGARATSHAVCRGGFLQHPARQPPATDRPEASNKVQLLVGLQGAYSLNRFSPEGAGYYRMSYCKGGCAEPVCSRAERMLLTASAHDSAAKLGAWAMEDAHFPAAQLTYQQTCDASRQNKPLPPIKARFNHWRTPVTPQGQARLAPDPACQPGGQAAGSSARRFDYLNASDIIHRQAYGTGGDAHSDIYRTELARMIWEFMPPTPFAPTTSPNQTAQQTATTP